MKTHIVIERSSGEFEIWRQCDETYCHVFHGPIAVCRRKWDAETIVRRLNEGSE